MTTTSSLRASLGSSLLSLGLLTLSDYIRMKRNRVFALTVLIACLSSASCKRQREDKEAVPFRIIATDAGFQAPDRIAAGLRHILFENHGSEIHESMLVKLPAGMSAEEYVAAVKKGAEFPEGALDYSGPG